jgi:single-strand DNA-binding protein
VASNINTVTLIGRLTRDPELRHTAGGTPVGSFSLAINSREKNSDGEWGDRADYFDVTVFGNQAETVAQYLGKGRLVGISGRLRQDRWETQEGGKRSKVVVIANSIQFLDRADDGEGGGSYGGQGEFVPAGAPAEPNADDDIPF